MGGIPLEVEYEMKIIPMRGSNIQTTTCPKCGAQVPFLRAENPIMDSAGFEAYTRKCNWCGALFAGVIDPYDEAFLAEPID